MRIPKFIKVLTRHSSPGFRQKLGDVRFERDCNGNTHVVATDGRQLAVASWHEDMDSPAQFTVNAKKLRQQSPHGGEIDPAEFSNGDFPKWREAFPRNVKGSGISVDPELLKKFCDTVITASKGQKRASMQLYITDEFSALAIRADIPGTVIRGLLMPLARDDGKRIASMQDAMEIDQPQPQVTA